MELVSPWGGYGWAWAGAKPKAGWVGRGLPGERGSVGPLWVSWDRLGEAMSGADDRRIVWAGELV